MKPETPEAALARALHEDTYGEDHVEYWPTCCVFAEDDVRQAVRVIGFMEGWMVAPSVSLPSSAPSRGPRTSDIAAQSIDDVNERQWRVFCALRRAGTATDDELVRNYETSADGVLLPQTPQSIRTRRKELERAGHVSWTGETRLTRTGRPARVFAATSTIEVAA